METEFVEKKPKIIWFFLLIVVVVGIIVGYFIYFNDAKVLVDEEKSIVSTSRTIPQKVLDNKFGFLGGGEDDNPFVSNAGAAWVRPHPGPFLWDAMQKNSTSQIDFSATDEIIKSQQAQNYGTLVTLWPFADWDQAGRVDVSSCAVSEMDEFLPRNDTKGRMDYLPRYRCNPNDWSAYSTWVSAVVERYDGDGQSDMPGLEIQIKYWEVMNEPDLNYQSNAPKEASERLNFYNQGPAEYGELLKSTYSAIKEADPEAQVLIAGAAGGSDNMLSFYETLFTNMPDSSNYFDIANVHCISNDRETQDFNVTAYSKTLKSSGIKKPVWVTEAEAMYGDSAEENYQNTLKSTKGALSAGAEKIFYTRYDLGDTRTDMSEKKGPSESSMKQSEKWYMDITKSI